MKKRREIVIVLAGMSAVLMIGCKGNTEKDTEIVTEAVEATEQIETISVDIYAKSSECIHQVEALGDERLKEQYGVNQYMSYRLESSCSWELVGDYAEGKIVRRYYVPGTIEITADNTPVETAPPVDQTPSVEPAPPTETDPSTETASQENYGTEYEAEY